MAISRQVKRKQIILYQGEASPAVYLVTSGVVRAYSVLENGNEVIIALFGPGDYFPASYALSEAAVSLFYYESLTDCTIEAHSFEAFNDYRDTLPNDRQQQARRYMGALLHINALAQPTARLKMMHMLRYLAQRFGEPLPNKAFTRINVQLTQQDIANLGNMSRETTNIELNRLKQDGILLVRDRYYAVHTSKLSQAINDNLDDSVIKPL